MTTAVSNKEKYDKVFTEAFSLKPSELGDAVAYNATRAWDSIGHMSMVAALEDTFGISLETDDIVDFSSYNKGFEILAKYGIAFD
jgi:acyl carrier protein